MDELEALNMLLRAVGSSPVNSVTTNHPNVAAARVALDRVRKNTLRRGWWFNIDYNVTLTPDPTTGKIALSENMSGLITDDTCYVKRKGFLYDRCNQTFVIPCPVVMKRIIRLLDWDDMEGTAQEYIAYIAASQFVRDEIEDRAKEESFQKSGGLALVELNRLELEAGGYNMFNKPRAVQARAGVQPYHRNNKRFHGDPDV